MLTTTNSSEKTTEAPEAGRHSQREGTQVRTCLNVVGSLRPLFQPRKARPVTPPYLRAIPQHPAIPIGYGVVVNIADSQAPMRDENTRQPGVRFPVSEIFFWLIIRAISLLHF